MISIGVEPLCKYNCSCSVWQNVLDTPNRSRPASSLTSSPGSGRVSGSPSVFGGLHFGPGRRAADRPSNDSLCFKECSIPLEVNVVLANS
ncbi:hypothetical protein C0J52_28374 [Blattella germanica]|nr:hypothetical protein C0J52_28374 [Blattella germanica]